MIDLLRRKRNRDELARIHPAFRERFELLLADIAAAHPRGMLATGQPIPGRPRLQETWRSIADQEAKFNKGLSQVKGGGPHTNVLRGGAPASLATHFLDDDAPLAPSVEWVANLAVLARARGLQTGVLWAQSASSDLAPDRPRRLIGESYLAAGDVQGLVDLLGPTYKHWGFDPLHVEVVGWRRFYGAGPNLEGASS